MQKQQTKEKLTATTTASDKQQPTLPLDQQILELLKRQNRANWFSSSDVQKILNLDRKVTNIMSRLYGTGNNQLERKKENRPLSTDSSRSKQMYVYRHKLARASIGLTVRASAEVTQTTTTQPTNETSLGKTQPTTTVSVETRPKTDDELLQEMISAIQTKLNKEKETLDLEMGVLASEEEQLDNTIKALSKLKEQRGYINRRRHEKKQQEQKLENLRQQVKDLEKEILGEKQQPAEEPPPEKLATKKTRPQKTPPFYAQPGVSPLPE
jgi:hypothetical protein